MPTKSFRHPHLALAITLAAGFVGTWHLLGRSAAAVLRAP